MKKRISLLKILLAGVVTLCVGIWFQQIFMGDPHEKEVEWTMVSLKILRENITRFHQIEGRYPDSLEELQKSAAQNTANQYTNRDNREHRGSSSRI
jgi:hypothetical protein